METKQNRDCTRIAIGLRIKELRTKKRLSLLALSDLSGVSKSNIIGIEHGRYSAGLDVLTRLTTVLGAKVDIVDG